MRPQSTIPLLLVGLALLVSLAGCGGPTLAAPAPAPKVYTAQDALAAWQAHGLGATLGDTGQPTPAGLTASFAVKPPYGSGSHIMWLYVAASPDAAQAYFARSGPGLVLRGRWRQANLILLYRDDTAQPYLLALADLSP